MRIEQTDGTRMDFTFTAMKENVPTNAGDFSFTPPPGVTVINAQTPQ